MQFYQWTNALCGSDQANSRANPLRRIKQMYLPSLSCPVCGEVEEWTRRQYFPAHDPSWIDLHSPSDLPPDKWAEFACHFRMENSLTPDFTLFPGATVGVPHFELTSSIQNDVMWPFREAVVTRRLANIMSLEGLTGFSFATPQLQWNRRLHAKGLPLPDLLVLDILGRAWRSESQAEAACPTCGRIQVLNIGGPIDESRWDGSDVFYVDAVDVTVGVSEKVKDVLIQHRISNFRLIPVDEIISLELMMEQIRTRSYKIHPGIPLGY